MGLLVPWRPTVAVWHVEGIRPQAKLMEGSNRSANESCRDLSHVSGQVCAHLRSLRCACGLAWASPDVLAAVDMNRRPHEERGLSIGRRHIGEKDICLAAIDFRPGGKKSGLVTAIVLALTRSSHPRSACRGSAGRIYLLREARTWRTHLSARRILLARLIGGYYSLGSADINCSVRRTSLARFGGY